MKVNSLINRALSKLRIPYSLVPSSITRQRLIEAAEVGKEVADGVFDGGGND